MGRTKVTGWASRALALALLISMNACLKDDSSSSQSSVGAGAATPLSSIWTDTSTGAVGTNADTPLSDVWVDATTVTASGAGAILPSIDEVTYGYPTVYLTSNTDPRLPHQIMVQSSAAAVINPEDQLLTLINNYRLQTIQNQQVPQNGNQLPAGNLQVTAIPPSGKLRKCARGHCKHYGRLQNGHTGALPAVNCVGDNVQTGTVPNGVLPPGGRLPRAKVTATGSVQEVFSGPTFDTPTAAFNNLVNTNSVILTGTNYTYIGVGHWPQGDQSYYWNLIVVITVNPAN